MGDADPASPERLRRASGEVRASPVGDACAEGVGDTPPPALPHKGEAGGREGALHLSPLPSPLPHLAPPERSPGFAKARGERGRVAEVEGESAEDEASAAADGVDWEEVRHLYELTDVPTVDILRNFGLTPSQLRWRREREEWAARDPAAEKRQPGHAPARLRARLLLLHSTLLKRLERQAARHDAFDENEARALALMCGALSDLSEVTMKKEIERETTANVKPGREKNKNGGSDPDKEDTAWLRAELKKRIHRIRVAAGLEG